MMSMRAKSLPLFAGMAAMALTVPTFQARAQQVATSTEPSAEQQVIQKLNALQADTTRLQADAAKTQAETNALEFDAGLQGQRDRIV
ncbi:MAG: hypothetical protein WDN31_02570 [Hyphomicrobium sp.]